MPHEIVMPQLSDTMIEADLVAWLVPEGAKLRAGEPIAEIETDKSTVELEAPEDGTLERILVPAGTQAVAVGQVLAILRGVDDGEGIAPVTSIAVAAKQGAAPARLDDSRRASPLARRMAAQTGLDLEAIAGTGGDGRVLRADVERTLGRAAPRAASASPGISQAPTAVPAAGSYREERLSRARRTIADRLSAAKREIPHFYLHVECEIGAAVALREQLNRRGQERRLSLNDFVVRAAALALREVPAANASFVEGVLRLHSEVDVAIAVASDAGLITPIVRSAARKSLAQISAEARDLVARARDGRLAPNEYQGGTFTVSNLGMFGVDGLYAIVNPPQVAILGIGRVHPRPIARDGSVIIEPVTQLTLSADHRVVDGEVGAKLLGSIRAHLEDPLTLLL
jgi:pyruvate dehydrogenase E2 component (dihydrolipoamide acetyltransferase)